MLYPLTEPNRTLDPIFALFIGASAAMTRIRREEKEKGRLNFSDTVEVFQYRWKRAFAADAGPRPAVMAPSDSARNTRKKG